MCQKSDIFFYTFFNPVLLQSLKLFRVFNFLKIVYLGKKYNKELLDKCERAIKLHSFDTSAEQSEAHMPKGWNSITALKLQSYNCIIGTLFYWLTIGQFLIHVLSKHSSEFRRYNPKLICQRYHKMIFY